MITPQQGHVDTALTNVSVMFRNRKMVSESVFQPVPVDKESNKYFTYGKDNLRPNDDLRRPAGLAKQLSWSVSASGPYFCDGHAMADYIPVESTENSDLALGSLDVDVTAALTDKIFLNREVALEAALSSAMSPTDLSATAYANAWDTVGIDPVATIDTAKETIALACGQIPNVLLLSRPVFRAIRNNAKVTGRISGAANLAASQITAAMLAEVLEVEEVLVGEGVKLTSKEGQTDTSDWIWKKDALLFYRPPSPGLRTVALGYQFTWQAGRLGSLVYRSFDEKRHADYIEVMRYYDLKVISASAGKMWTNATQN